MIRSFDYAAAVVKRKSLASHAHVADPSRDAFLHTFVERATQCFLAGYHEALSAGGRNGRAGSAGAVPARKGGL